MLEGGGVAVPRNVGKNYPPRFDPYDWIQADAAGEGGVLARAIVRCLPAMGFPETAQKADDSYCVSNVAAVLVDDRRQEVHCAVPLGHHFGEVSHGPCAAG
jgi:hypothetical protein